MNFSFDYTMKIYKRLYVLIKVTTVAFIVLFPSVIRAESIDIVCDLYYVDRPKDVNFYKPYERIPEKILNFLPYVGFIKFPRKAYISIHESEKCVKFPFGKYCSDFGFVIIYGGSNYVNTFNAEEISLFKQVNGVVDSKAYINRVTGFFYTYNIHTDGSIKGLAIGEPYSGAFGYCSQPKRKF